MRIKPEELKEFKQIYFEEFGIWLDDLEATRKSLNLLSGIEMILKFEHRSASGIDKET